VSGSNLEAVVRPFQAAEAFNAKALAPPTPSATGGPLPDVEQVWGNPIQLLSKAIGVTNLNTGGKHWSEVSRTTSTVRVTNPTDPTQFVDVARVDSLHLQDENGADHFMTLNNG
jgi:hypothetical protein